MGGCYVPQNFLPFMIYFRPALLSAAAGLHNSKAIVRYDRSIEQRARIHVARLWEL